MSDDRRDDARNDNPSPDPNPNPNPSDPERTEPMGGDKTEPQDWSKFDPFAGEREARRQQRDAFDAAREAARAARDAAREATREAERRVRDAERDAERMARERERMARDQERVARDQDRANRQHEREERHRERERERERQREEWRLHATPGNLGLGPEGRHMRIEIDSEGFASRFLKGFVSDATGESFDETVSREFTIEHMPRLRVRNISGATIVRTGEAGKISVIAKKLVYASSEDRAKRLLQNLDIRMEQHGDELRIEPHLYEQERGWVDLFRGKRFRVDFEITVPRECAVDAQTVSGELTVSGVRGPVETQSVSGEIGLADIEGPLRLKSVSGDVTCRRYVGHIEGNTVSGDVVFDAVRVRSLQLHTVSGDVELKGILEPAREHRLRTISGDIELSLADPDIALEYRTASGDLECEVPARVTRHSRKEYNVALGEARGHAVVKTVSGDLTITSTVVDVPGVASTEEPSAARGTEWIDVSEPESPVEAYPAEAAVPPVPPVPPGPPQPPVDMKAREEIKGVLEKLAKGELNLDDAAAALDAARRSAPGGPSPRGQR